MHSVQAPQGQGYAEHIQGPAATASPARPAASRRGAVWVLPSQLGASVIEQVGKPLVK